jgi:hypothetical protein
MRVRTIIARRITTSGITWAQADQRKTASHLSGQYPHGHGAAYPQLAEGVVAPAGHVAVFLFGSSVCVCACACVRVSACVSMCVCVCARVYA